MDDFFGFLIVLALTALVFFAVLAILGIALAVSAGLLVLLSPFIVIGFMEGWEDRARR